MTGTRRGRTRWACSRAPLEDQPQRPPLPVRAQRGPEPRVGDNWEGVNDVRNNVVYNWRNFGPAENYGGAPVNYVNNVFLGGPNSSPVEREHLLGPDRTKQHRRRLYLDGNRGRSARGVHGRLAAARRLCEGGLVYPPTRRSNGCSSRSRAAPVTTWRRASLDRVLDGAGATLPRRDAVDTRIVGEVRTRTGAVGIGSDYPVLRGISPPATRTTTGARRLGGAARPEPDESVRPQRRPQRDGYTNLEEYLNARDPRAPARRPAGRRPRRARGRTALTLRGAGDRITLEWGASCREGDTDFAVYEGSLAASKPPPHHCSTGGRHRAGPTAREGTIYCSVVPRDALARGLVRVSGGGAERPAVGCAVPPQEIHSAREVRECRERRARQPRLSSTTL